MNDGGDSKLFWWGGKGNLTVVHYGRGEGWSGQPPSSTPPTPPSPTHDYFGQFMLVTTDLMRKYFGFD